MINANKEEDTFLKSFHNTLLEYHLQISKQLPNPPSYKYLSQIPIKELFSSLQLSIFMLNKLIITNQQAQYESQLRSYESQLRTQYRIRCLMKLKVEAMESKLLTLLLNEEEFKTSRITNSLLAQKENEILILRAENSNLKLTIAKIEKSNQSSDTDNDTMQNRNLNNNINININDITNSNVIIKTSERYADPITPIKKTKRDYYLSSSQSNRNILYQGSFSPHKNSKSYLYQTKTNTKDYGLNDKFTSNTVKKTNKNTCSNNKEGYKQKEHKSSLSNLIVYSLYQNSQNNTIPKGIINNTPRAETIRNVPKYNTFKK